LLAQEGRSIENKRLNHPSHERAQDGSGDNPIAPSRILLPGPGKPLSGEDSQEIA
jgi:hypothetical protein